MQITSHISNAQGYVWERWPTYVFGYGGGTVATLLIIWISINQGWYSFIIIAFALLVFLAYLFLASLWAAGYAHDIELLRDTLFGLGKLQPTDNLVHICLGRRHIPARFSRRLTTGHITVLDTYNPQLTPGRPLARARQRARFTTDPRISWRDGSTNLLPVPDASVNNITIVHAASEYWQQGDQEQLFLEIFRILAPGGQLLIAESVRSPTSILTCGFSGLRYQSAKYWETLVVKAGFRLSNKTIIKDLVTCWRFDRPLPDEADQLIIEF
jgi:ubiquinone/menaquinone biosynthesis C-methylase UbiE